MAGEQRSRGKGHIGKYCFLATGASDADRYGPLVPSPDPHALPAAPPLQLGPIPPELAAQLNPFARQAADDDDEEFRISELSDRSGVAIGTIKFYLREGLLPPGRAAGKTQALYTGAHVRRLRLVRALSEVGGLSVAQMRSIVAVIDEGQPGPVEVTAAVAHALDAAPGRLGRAAGGSDAGAQERLAQARADSDEFVAALGLRVDADAPAREQLARALASLRALELAESPLVFTEHAIAAYDLARREIDHVLPPPSADGRAVEPRPEDIAVGIVVFGSAFLALRALAAEHEVRRRLGEQ